MVQSSVHPLWRGLFALPVVGWLIKDALLGHDDAMTYFLMNCAALWILAVLWFGYPAAMIPALIAVPIVFTVLIVITRG